MGTLDNLTGRRFGRLTVVGPHISVKRRTMWPCLCDCGGTTTVMASSLKRGLTQSCGCLSSETTAARNRSHGKASRKQRVPEYAVWHLMRQRCNDPNSKAYPHYGGRGIKVCDRWSSFANFYADMGSRPTPDHQLDRVNNESHYEPGNVRWTTRIVNGNNRRDNRRLTLNGETMTMSNWSRQTGIKVHTIHQRLDRLGWSVERALTTPTRIHSSQPGWTPRPPSANPNPRRYLEHDGRRQTVAAWARETGLNYHTIVARTGPLGWPVDRALTTPAHPRRAAA